ncbi:hypothetical protein D3C78_720100 [compost metagenome]
MIEVALLPLFERPVLFQQEQGVQAHCLGGEHERDVFGCGLQFLEGFRAFGLDLGRHRFLWRTVGVKPVQAHRLAVDAQLGQVSTVGQLFAAQANLFQAVAGYAELFDLVTGQGERFGGAGEGFFQLFLGAVEPDPGLEQGQLANGLGRRNRRQGIHRGVADLGRPGTDAADFTVGAQGHPRECPGQLAVGQHRCHPQQTTQDRGVAFAHARAIIDLVPAVAQQRPGASAIDVGEPAQQGSAQRRFTDVRHQRAGVFEPLCRRPRCGGGAGLTEQRQPGLAAIGRQRLQFIDGQLRPVFAGHQQLPDAVAQQWVELCL